MIFSPLLQLLGRHLGSWVRVINLVNAVLNGLLGKGVEMRAGIASGNLAKRRRVAIHLKKRESIIRALVKWVGSYPRYGGLHWHLILGVHWAAAGSQSPMGI